MTRYYDKALRETRIETGATCNRCKEVLPVVRFRGIEVDVDTGGMYSDALRLRAEGWYGGYIDPMGSGPGIDLCKTCADAFIAFMGVASIYDIDDGTRWDC
jgi:hypothetical protein